MDSTAKTYSLVFSFPDVIVGNGFTARVELKGHALFVQEGEESTWLYGVQPGAVAGGGKDWAEATRAFKENYLSVLFDIAIEAVDYEGFKSAVEAFFSEVNEPNQEEWARALDNVRRNPDQLAGHTTVKAEDHPPCLRVSMLDQRSMNPRVNQFDAVEVARAAAA
ncbi:MAG TPA: hypothetical protein VH853_00160 [Polyangia bacterium]|jgi:hypothetical protein|nr:hypothetical protein [Polyangia bacterium]